VSVPLPFSILEDTTDNNNDRYKDVQSALLAVFAGCRAAHIVQPRGDDSITHSSSSSSFSSSNNDNNDSSISMTKIDTSPVTIGDYAAQAVVLHILNTTTTTSTVGVSTCCNNDDDTYYIAEEGSDALLGIIQQQQHQQQHSSTLSTTFDDEKDDERSGKQQELTIIEDILDVTNRATAGLHIGAGPTTTTTTTNKKKLISNVQALLNIIDHRGGNDETSRQSKRRIRRRVWCLDPIDGTKGFLRGRTAGGQYCVALALIENGIPVLGILGCPNMPTVTTATSSSATTLTSTTATASNSSSIPQYGQWSEDEIRIFDKAEEENRKNEMNDDHDDTTYALFSCMPKRGCVFLAVRGYGCYEVSLHELEKHYLGNKSKTNTLDKKEEKTLQQQLLWKRLQVTTTSLPINDSTTLPPINVSTGKFCLGIERTFSDPDGIVLQMACDIQGPSALTTTPEADLDDVDIVNSVRFDGQGKYGLLARGEAQYFVRLPKAGYIDWVWDVAAGYVVLTEAGGSVTDVTGKDIEFTNIGNNHTPRQEEQQENITDDEEEQRWERTIAKLPDHLRGIVGSSGGVYHQALLDAYARVQAKITQQ
jgi:3'-phosphoadenosine 5'-phosphosulfate (PAPS) 3'-phosphatase